MRKSKNLHIENDIIESNEITNLSFYLYVLIKANCSYFNEGYSTTLNKIVTDCGYSIDRHKGKSNDKVMQALVSLISSGLISVDKPMLNIKTNTLICFRADGKNKVLLFDSDTILKESEWYAVAHFDSYKVESLRCLLYIKSMLFLDERYKLGSVRKRELKQVLSISNDSKIDGILRKIINSELLYTHKTTSNKNGAYYSLIPFNKVMRNICDKR